jgi:hypothetical protein
MTLVPLENVKEITSTFYVYSEVADIKQVYLNGNQFLKFTHMSRSTKSRETVCISSDSIKGFEYYNTTPELKTQSDVLQAYKEGRLVGY